MVRASHALTYTLGLLTPLLITRAWGVFVTPWLLKEHIPGYSLQCGACKGIATVHMCERKTL